jgi:hypothetical protein
MMMRIMKDGFPSFRMEDYIEGAKDFHDILIRPCHQIPQGWVCLERKL